MNNADRVWVEVSRVTYEQFEEALAVELGPERNVVDTTAKGAGLDPVVIYMQRWLRDAGYKREEWAAKRREAAVEKALDILVAQGLCKDREAARRLVAAANAGA